MSLFFSDDQDSNDLKLNNRTKYFVCNYCGHWQTVNPEDIRDIVKPYKGKKKDIHLKIRPEFHDRIKSLAANFDGYEQMLLVLINEFLKNEKNKKFHNQLSRSDQNNLDVISLLPKPEQFKPAKAAEPGHDTINDEDHKEVLQ